MNCKHCNKEISQIEGKKTRLYCNDACRMAFKRKSEQIISEQPEQIKSEQKAIIGKCHSCGENVSDLICICLKCTSQGITHKSLGMKMCSEK